MIGNLPVSPSSELRRPTRRAALKALAFAGLVAAAGEAIALVRGRGYAVFRPKPFASLAPWEFVVVEHAARRIAAPDHPDDLSIPTADDLDVAGFVDGYAARLSVPVRRDLRRALLYLEQVAPLVRGHGSRFTELSAEDQDHVLQALEASPLMPLRGAFAGLKSLVFMGYYRDPRAWALIGYEGPMRGRVPRDAGRPRP
jgi:hypothetical protein